MNEIDVLIRHLEREQHARREAEKIGEEKITELYNLSCDLEVSLNLQKKMNEELIERNRAVKIQKVKAEHEAYLKEMLTNILNSSIRYSIIASDIDGTIIIWNKGAQNNYGYTEVEMVGKKNIKFLYQDGGTDHDITQAFFNMVNSEGIAEGVFKRHRKDDRYFLASVVMTLRKNELGYPIGYLIISKDITEENRIKEQLIKTNQELEQFAHIVSHDLKSPLRGISNLSSWIIKDCAGKLSEESNKHLFLLNQHVNRMAALIDGILRYSQAGRVNLEVVTVDVKELLQDIMDNLHLPEAFTVYFKDPLPVFLTAKIPLAQVFSNLIDNSIKHHHRRDGKIEIGVSNENDYQFEFYIKDDGPGIDSRYQEKIFEIFETVNTDHAGENTGIGLSIVKKIVESQGGKVRLQSQLGQGTTFYFTWSKYLGKFYV